MLFAILHYPIIHKAVAELYVTNSYERDLVLQGAADSWSVDRVWKGHLADIMAAIPL